MAQTRIVTQPDPVPGWLIGRLNNIAASDKKHPHYESSLGGPHNELLHSYFPHTARYMVKPIPRLRKHVDQNTPPNARTSIDSNGLSVEVRDDDIIPDFLVCKATEGLHSDKPFLIWELKKDDLGPAITALQLDRYEQWLLSYRHLVVQANDTVPGLWMGIVQKDNVVIHQYGPLSPGQIPDPIMTTSGTVLSDNVHQALAEISTFY